VISRDVLWFLEKKCTAILNITNRNCPVLKKHMEIARVMFFDNLPFLEARLLQEKNINSSRVILVKSLRNFPCLPDMDSTAHEIQRSYLELADSSPSYKSVLNSSNGSIKKVLSSIIDRILTDKDAEVLCELRKL